MQTILDPDTGEELPIYPDQARTRELEEFYKRVCEHPRKELRRVINNGGSKAIRYQCLDCGELVGSAVSSKTISGDIPDADMELRGAKHSEREAARFAIDLKYARLQRDQRAKGEDDYSKYLKSEKWAGKRAKVMERAGGLCEGCRDRKATVVHHLTYEHIGDELLFELVALCRDCHERCHPEHHDELGEDDYWYESKCNACRWGGGEQNGVEWCGILDVSAKDAQSGENECAKATEPLK